jgi:hypothetical protein
MNEKPAKNGLPNHKNRKKNALKFLFLAAKQQKRKDPPFFYCCCAAAFFRKTKTRKSGL